MAPLQLESTVLVGPCRVFFAFFAKRYETVAGSPSVRRISQYDNSMRRRGGLEEESDSDSDSEDLASLASRLNMGSKEMDEVKNQKNARTSIRSADNNTNTNVTNVTTTNNNNNNNNKVDKSPVGAVQQASRPLANSGDDGESDSSEEVDLTAAVMTSIATNPMKSSTKSPRGEKGAEPSKRSSVTRKAAPEVAKQLRFLGQQFSTIKSEEVKQLVEVEKAKQEVYTFEWEANEQKPDWKQGLLLAAMKPDNGIRFLVKQGLIKVIVIENFSFVLFVNLCCFI
jgi:hypothetical protein